MNNPLGANWKTTVSGIGAALFSMLTIIAALPYELGDVATIISPAWKAKIVTTSAICALALKVWNSVAQKSANVTGGTVQQDVTGAVVPAECKPTLVATTKAETPAN